MKGKNTSRIAAREEAQVVKDLEAHGYSARRQPGSGNRAFDMQHDIVWRDSPLDTLHIEDKYREKTQWQRLDNYRGGADILTVRCSANLPGQNPERMAFLPWKLLLDLIGDADERSHLNCGEKSDWEI